MKNKTNPILSGLGFAAVAFVTALLAKYVPLVTVLYLLLPVYLSYYARRYGFWAGLIWAAAGGATAFIIYPAVSAAGYALYLAFAGGAVSYAYRKNAKGFTKLWTVYLAMLAALFVGMAIYQAVTGRAFSVQIVQSVKQGYDAMMTSASAAIDSAELASLGRRVTNLVGMMIPSMLLIVPFFPAWLVVILSDKALRDRGISNNALPPLSHWIVPRHLARFLLIMLIVSFFGTFATMNIYIMTFSTLTDFVFGLMGMSFLFWIFNRRRPRESMGVKVAIVVVCGILFSVMSQILPLIGVIDIYSSLRLHIMLRNGRK